MSRNVPENAYLLANESSDHIPLEVGRPKYSRLLNISASTAVEMPEDLNLCLIVADGPFQIVAESRSPAVADWTVGGFYCSEELYYQLLLPKQVTFIPEGPTEIKINCLVKWAAIKNEGNYIKS